MRYDDGHKARTHALIISHAAQVIRLKGPEQMSVASLMQQVGLTHGGFYAHFKTKDELIAAAIKHMFAESLAYFDQVVAGHTGKDAITAYINFYLSGLHRDKRAEGCPLATIAQQLTQLAPVGQQAFTSGMQQLLGKLANYLADAGFADANALSYSVFADMVGAITLARCELNQERSDQMLNASRTALYTRLALI